MVVWNTVTITASAAIGSTYIAIRGTRRMLSAMPWARKWPLARSAAAKAVFLAYPVCVAQQCPGAPQASTTGPNRSRSSCAAPGKAMNAIFFSSSLTVCSRRRSPCCKRRPVRTTAYSAEKPMAYSVSPTIGAMGLCSSLCHSFPSGADACGESCAAAARPGIGTAPTASAASGDGAAVQAAQQAAAPLFYLQSTGFFSFLRCCRAFSGPEHNS